MSAATKSSAAILRRSLLYVPSSSPYMLAKSLGFTSDNITYDLEDSITPAAKPDARIRLQSHLASLPSQRRPQTTTTTTTTPSSSSTTSSTFVPEIAVRINAVATPFALVDLTTLASLPAIDTIVVPKVQSAADLRFVTDVLRHVCPERQNPSTSTSPPTSTPSTHPHPQPIKLLALIESARAITNLPAICRASPLLTGLIFAAEDFALDLSLTRTPSLSEFLYARSALVTAARAANLPSAIDLVCTAFRGHDARRTLEHECDAGRALGFNGKQCIHPDQVHIVQRLFAPSPQELEWAVRLVVADDKAAAAGRGAWTMDGKMVDAPVSGKARAIVAKAEQCGMDVDSLRTKWKDHEPE